MVVLCPSQLPILLYYYAITLIRKFCQPRSLFHNLVINYRILTVMSSPYSVVCGRTRSVESSTLHRLRLSIDAAQLTT